MMETGRPVAIWTAASLRLAILILGTLIARPNLPALPVERSDAAPCAGLRVARCPEMNTPNRCAGGALWPG